MKRPRVDEETNSQSPTSAAANLNTKVLRKLQQAFEADPTIDLLSIFPTGYSTRISRMRKQDVGRAQSLSYSSLTYMLSEVSAVTPFDTRNYPTEEHDTRKSCRSKSTSSINSAEIIFPLSQSVETLLRTHTVDISTFHLSMSLSTAIESSEIIWQSKACQGHLVVKCNSEIVVKIVPNLDDHTEYTTMQYLARHASAIPAPKPLGLILSNNTSYIFMSYVPGLTVDAVWSKLDEKQKVSIRDQLDDALIRTRQLKMPGGVPLGSVGGEGYKDTRRHTRICREPMYTCADAENFQFFNPHFGSSQYIALLRGLLRSNAASIVFTHGDIRPENVIVRPDAHGNYSITGILDWEKSGWYPDWFECTKATSNLSSSDKDDWYLYLPTCASPSTFPVQWLVDRIWDVHVA
ncbi:MAG: hypothetical protein Q9170_001990 [Blastenia crenularia]